MPEGTLSIISEKNISNLNTKNNNNLCTYCGYLINDQYIYKVAPDLKWHEKCLKCVECNKNLEENAKCYIKNNKAYCKEDYLKLFSLKCFRCGLILKANEMVMKCKMLICHYNCFNCDYCNKKFQPGDEFTMKDNNVIICKEDYSLNSESRITSTPSATLSVNVNYRNLINSDDSSFSPSVSSSSSIESSISHLHNNILINNNTNNNNLNSINGISELSSYSPLSVNYNNYSNTEHNYNDYNYQLIRDDDGDDDDDSDDDNIDDTSSEKDVNIIGYNNNNNNNNSKQISSLHNYSSSKNMNSKPARVRTVLNEKQLHTLRACYGANPRPDALMKEQLVEMTGLSPRVIRVWFQNKRCKDKKKTLLNRQNDSNQHQQHSQHVMFERCF